MTQRRKQAIITLTTDFGTRDSYVAEMKGAILSRFQLRAKPGTPLPLLVDVSHEIPPYDIAYAARLLGQLYPAYPPGTIHLAVIDPGVGGKRKSLILEAEGHIFIGPDNGLFTHPARTDQKRRIFEIKSGSVKPSATFHGRDIFAPCAAEKALKISSLRLGRLIPAMKLLKMDAPVWDRSGKWLGRIIGIDHFGNAATNFPAALFRKMQKPVILVKKHKINTISRSFSDIPDRQPALIINSQNFVEIVLSKQSLSRVLNVKKGDPVILSEMKQRKKAR